MRDLQHLEELSRSAALGLWADDVVMALHRAAATTGPDHGDQQLLTDAADILDATQERADQPFANLGSARDLAATDATLNVVATLAHEHASANADELQDVRGMLVEIAEVLRAAATGQLAGRSAVELEPALTFFSTVGEVQLAETNSVLAARKDAGTWTAMQMISRS